MAEEWRHLCHGKLHNVSNILFGSPNREFLANSKRRQRVHAQLKKDQLCLQHPEVFYRQQRKGHMEGVNEENLNKSHPEKSAYK